MNWFKRFFRQSSENNTPKREGDVNFFDVKDSILDALRKRWDLLGIDEKVAIIDGFFNPAYSDILTDQIILGGPTVPMVVLVGTETGRVYLFAYKALMEEKQNKESK